MDMIAWMNQRASAGGEPARLLRPLLIAFVGIACALVVAFTSYDVVNERRQLVEREKDSLVLLAESLSAQSSSLFGGIEFFLRSVDRWLLSHPETDPRSDADFAAFVGAFRETMRGVVDLRLVSEAGGLHYVPSASNKPLSDVSDREYFRVQADPATRGFHVASPVLSRVTGLWGIPISYPLVSRNAGISVAFAAIELPSLERVYERFRPRPNGTITLIRGDGLILARSPLDGSLVGKRFGGEETWSALSSSAGSRAVTRVGPGADGRERITAYLPVGELGLYVAVSSLLADVLAPWKARLPRQLGFALALLALLGAIAARLLRLLNELEGTRAALAAGLEDLERSTATRDKLFSIVSHDLRGPIGGIRSLLDSMVLDRSSMSGRDLDECLKTLASTAEGTSQLLEDLLAWSRSQRGDLRFEPRLLGLAELAEAASLLVAPSAAAKGLRLELSVQSGLEVFADADMLSAAIRNLLVNAVKYSKPGGLVRLEAVTTEGGVCVAVSDEGVGMEAERLAKVFDVVSLRSMPGTAGERGSGLGLALCEDIARRHGGRVSASSELGKGSRFELILPPPAPPPRT